MNLARPLSRCQLAFTTACLLSIASIAWAQPEPDGIAVGSTGQLQDQSKALVCPDGQGGYFVAWGEEVLNSTTGVDGYLQHVLAGGQLDPNWPSRGMLFVDAPDTQDVGAMISDGNGGVILYWRDSRNPLSRNDLFALRVNGNGQLAAGWTPNGTPVCAGLDERQLESMCPDGAGGSYFAWDDSIQTTERARVIHLMGDGSLAAGWPTEGRLVTNTAPANGGARLLAEPDGYLVTWADLRGQTQYGVNLFATRFTATGDVYPGWNPIGTQLLTLGTATNEWRAATDGAGGAFVAWDDNRVGSPPWFSAYDIYAQHIFADGTRDTRWPKDGVPVCDTPDAQNDFDIAADSSGGCDLIWLDNRPDYVYGQRLRADGSVAPGWMPNGVSVRNQQFAPYTPPWAVPDGKGGFYGVWTEYHADLSVVVGQHMQGDGTFDPSWTASGRILASNFPGGGDCNYPAIVADGLGGAALAYERSNVGPWLRIYAMHVQADIPTPTLLTFADEQISAGTVRLTWFTPDGSGLRATAQRSTDGANWDDVAQLTSDAAGEFVLQDRVAAGGRFDYRLGVAVPGGEQFTDGHWVEIPVGVAFGLTSVGPNPSRGGINVAFALAAPGAASLDLFNVAGRRVLHRDVTALNVGAHTLELAKDGQLPSGVYVLRLVQGGRAVERKIAVVR